MVDLFDRLDQLLIRQNLNEWALLIIEHRAATYTRYRLGPERVCDLEFRGIDVWDK